MCDICVAIVTLCRLGVSRIFITGAGGRPPTADPTNEWVLVLIAVRTLHHSVTIQCIENNFGISELLCHVVTDVPTLI